MENITQIAGYAKRILEEIGIQCGEDFLRPTPIINTVDTKEYIHHAVKINVEIIKFTNTYRIEVNFRLPEDGVLANTFMDHCAAIEKTPKNHHNEYCAGPTYPDSLAELHAKKHTFAFSPWDNNMFYVCSEGYAFDEIEEATTNVIKLANQFAKHLQDLKTLRFWTATDKEVIQKAKEIIQNAKLEESDVDRENRSHLLRDANSFFKGWFYPFNNRGRGTFDIHWPSSLNYAANTMGNKGTFEYAVATVLLQDDEFIAKAREACHIRQETQVIRY